MTKINVGSEGHHINHSILKKNSCYIKRFVLLLSAVLKILDDGLKCLHDLTGWSRNYKMQLNSTSKMVAAVLSMR